MKDSYTLHHINIRKCFIQQSSSIYRQRCINLPYWNMLLIVLLFYIATYLTQFIMLLNSPVSCYAPSILYTTCNWPDCIEHNYLTTWLQQVFPVVNFFVLHHKTSTSIVTYVIYTITDAWKPCIDLHYSEEWSHQFQLATVAIHGMTVYLGISWQIIFFLSMKENPIIFILLRSYNAFLDNIRSSY